MGDERKFDSLFNADHDNQYLLKLQFLIQYCMHSGGILETNNGKERWGIVLPHNIICRKEENGTVDALYLVAAVQWIVVEDLRDLYAGIGLRKDKEACAVPSLWRNVREVGNAVWQHNVIPMHYVLLATMKPNAENISFVATPVHSIPNTMDDRSALLALKKYMPNHDQIKKVSSPKVIFDSINEDSARIALERLPEPWHDAVTPIETKLNMKPGYKALYELRKVFEMKRAPTVNPIEQAIQDGKVVYNYICASPETDKTVLIRDSTHLVEYNFEPCICWCYDERDGKHYQTSVAPGRLKNLCSKRSNEVFLSNAGEVMGSTAGGAVGAGVVGAGGASLLTGVGAAALPILGWATAGGAVVAGGGSLVGKILSSDTDQYMVQQLKCKQVLEGKTGSIRRSAREEPVERDLHADVKTDENYVDAYNAYQKNRGGFGIDKFRPLGSRYVQHIPIFGLPNDLALATPTTLTVLVNNDRFCVVKDGNKVIEDGEKFLQTKTAYHPFRETLQKACVLAYVAKPAYRENIPILNDFDTHFKNIVAFDDVKPIQGNDILLTVLPHFMDDGDEKSDYVVFPDLMVRVKRDGETPSNQSTLTEALISLPRRIRYKSKAQIQREISFIEMYKEFGQKAREAHMSTDVDLVIDLSKTGCETNEDSKNPLLSLHGKIVKL